MSVYKRPGWTHPSPYANAETAPTESLDVVSEEEPLVDEPSLPVVEE